MITTTMMSYNMGNFNLPRYQVVLWCAAIILINLNYVIAINKAFYIDEGKPSGEYVGNVNTKILHIHPSPVDFRFDKNTGKITTAVILDREFKSSYDFTVTNKTRTFVVSILVRDVNDEFPTFTSRMKTVNISEAHPVGYRYYLDIYLSDKDVGKNTVHNDSVRIVSGNNGNIFKINLIKQQNDYLLVLIISKKLNWTRQHKYNLNLTASDNGTPPKTGYMVLTVLVEDYNNCYPEFSRQTYVADVSESIMKGTTILNISTSDCDGGQNAKVDYKMNYDSYDTKRFFSVQQNGRIGHIVTNINFDYEGTKVYRLQVIATDKGIDPKQREAEIIVNVHDENDNSPNFGSFLLFPIYEDAKINSKVAEIHIDDKDSGENARLNVSVSPANAFSISNISLHMYNIYLKTSLDHEQQKTYHIIVTATDNGKPPLTSQRDESLRIRDVNDNPPRFDPDFYRREINESAGWGTVVLKVNTTDADDVSTSVKVYSILNGNYSSWFGINSTSGVIFVASIIDREETDKVTLVVKLVDGTFTANCTVELCILDANDNPPTFSSMHYYLNVMESSKPGLIGKVDAEDVDTTSQGFVSFSLNVSADARNIFAVNKTTGDISALKTLDREEVGVYNFNVIAHDEGGLWSTAKVTVTVGDKNDNAPILNDSSISIREDQPINETIYTFHAVDKDIGVNGKIWYKFIDDDQAYFELSRDGVLTLKKSLDREKQDKHEVTVIAGDKGAPIRTSLPAKLTITVMDVNDEAPMFLNELKITTVEGIMNGTYIGKVEAIDRDSGRNAEIEYSLVNSTVIRIDPVTGKVYNLVILDSEKYRVYTTQVVASDKGLIPQRTEATLRIYIKDINDNTPKFRKNVYYFSVAENQPRGTKVAQVEALDADDGVNGEVVYYLNTGGRQGFVQMFQINETTGLIYNVGILDREVKDFFVLSVIAMDRGIPRREAVCQVLVTVLDVNDHKPEFRVKNATIYIQERTTVGTVVYWANATDGDAIENANITYSIVKDTDVFSINEKTGGVILSKALDYEQIQQYSLRIRASDGAKKNPKKSILRLYINVLDSNENAPSFSSNPMYRYVLENKPGGTAVQDPITAKDKDSGMNSKIVYSIESQKPKAAFIINPHNGQLTTDTKLDREDVNEYTLVVKANDQAGDISEQRFSTVTVKILVGDENDCSPTFTTPNETFVMEDEPINYTVICFNADDQDSKDAGVVTYSLVKGNDHGIFYLDPIDGCLELRKTLDRESVESYKFEIKASDQGSPSLSSTMIFLLSVEDVNDNLPRFKDYIYDSDVLENVIGADVVTVKATDQDSSSKLTYSLPAGYANDSFAIDESTGKITTRLSLDREKQDTLILTVYVRDNGYPIYTDRTTVIVNVLDKNDNPPTVLDNDHEVMVPENCSLGYVYTVIAQDYDQGVNARLRYTIYEGNTYNYFAIDEDSGVISTNTKLDHENISQFDLGIRIDDEGNSSLHTTARVRVHVQNKNDNNPRFNSSEVNLRLSGNIHPGTKIATLKATDADVESNANISYSFADDQEIPFGLDSSTGSIYVLNYLNASEVDKYSFSVRASDGSRCGVLYGYIKVNVFADKMSGAPLRFTKTLYEVSRRSGVNTGAGILQLEFKDRYLQPGDIEFVGSGDKGIAVDFLRGNVSFTEGPLPGVYLLSVKATLKHERSITAVCFILVTVNRTINRPKFSQSLYTATIGENYPTGSVVLRVKPFDAGNLSYFEIVNGNELDAFKIDALGDIRVKNESALDYERSRAFHLDVKGHWRNNVTSIAFTEVIINIRNIHDEAPVFRQKVFVYSINESDFGVNHDNRFITTLHVFRYNNTKLSFSIQSGNENGIFLLEPSTGILSIQKVVRYEERNFYNLKVTVKANQLTSTCYVHLFITDINNNQPHLPPSLHFTINENSPLGSHVGRVAATDKDLCSFFTYEFANGKQLNDPFLIDRYSGVLRLVRVVDFETKPNSYNLLVRVTDGQFSDATNVSVIVLDNNDNRPVFEKYSYSTQRKTVITNNTLLARINATDNDEGDNRRITYSITDNDEIAIDNKTGEVYTLKEILYIKDFIDLIITATDHGDPQLSSQVPFQLQILHVSTTPPLLDNVTHVDVPENAEIGTEVIKIKPLNSNIFPDNKRISFEILKGNALKMFRIEERTGIIRVRRALDRETVPSYTLEVIAKERFNVISNLVQVHITIDDVNDNSPIFKRNTGHNGSGSMYERTISEDEKPGYLVLTVSATDRDSGLNGKLRYSISSGNSDGWFSINHEGKLILASYVDRDVIPIHRLSVTATDLGTPPRSSDISVVVIVTDVNDNAPKFNTPKDLGVKENAKIGSYAGSIKATDPDAGENQIIHFFIVDGTGLGKFNIEKISGNLTSLVVFDYENRTSYTLWIKAKDLGSPSKNNTLIVDVPIIGIDEYEPKFQSTSYNFVVPGNSKESDVIGRVEAFDLDDGPDGEVIYSLLNTSFDLVAINSSNGDLYLTKDVDEVFQQTRYKRDTEENEFKPDKYDIIIGASSGKPDSKWSSVTASIFLNYTAAHLPTADRPVKSSPMKTTYIAIGAVGFVALLILLVLFLKYRRKESNATKKTNEEFSLSPMRPLQTKAELPGENGFVNKYGHVQTSGSNSLASSGTRSSDTGYEEPGRRNVHSKRPFIGSNIAFSRNEAEMEALADSNVENSDARSYDVSSDRTDRIIANLQSIESLHDFDDEGGKEASAGLDVGNLLYAKCAEADAEESDQDRPLVFKFEGRPDYAGSLSSILGSHEELRGNYNCFYAMIEGPHYQPLSEVFSEIGRIPANDLNSSMNDDMLTRTSMLSSVSSLHNQHLDPAESTFSSLPISPNFTPAITPLLARSPSLSHSLSEITTPMASPSQSRPSSMFIPSSRPSSTLLIQLAERETDGNIEQDVHV